MLLTDLPGVAKQPGGVLIIRNMRWSMPVIHINLVEGRDSELIKACVKAVAYTVSETLGAPLETVRVYATLVPAAHWAVGGQTKDEQQQAATKGATL